VRSRGGIAEIITRFAKQSEPVGIRLELELPEYTATFELELGLRASGGYQVLKEECVVQRFPRTTYKPVYYRVQSGTVDTEMMLHHLPRLPDRLFLTSASSDSYFWPVYDALASMAFYHIDPNTIRTLQPAVAATQLEADGSNLTSILSRMGARDVADLEIVTDYLAHIVPGLQQIRPKQIERRETVEFTMQKKQGCDSARKDSHILRR
jgi:predicted ATPase